MESKSTISTEVEIFGNVYQIRSEHDRDHLLDLAARVDRTMRQISGHLTTVDSGKLAVLAALNLADELFQCTAQQEGERDRIMEKVAELTGELADALQE